MEGIPIALVESMAAGVACVATSSGSIAELVDETSGVLVPHSNPRAMAEALAELALDPQRRFALALSGRARVAREYDIRKTGATLAALMSKGRVPNDHHAPMLQASSASEL
jgi:glycosyltransferase involved in cell wall biosynthesis